MSTKALLLGTSLPARRVFCAPLSTRGRCGTLGLVSCTSGPSRHCHTTVLLQPLLVRKRFPRHATRAHEQGNSGYSRDPTLEDYLEVKVDQVRVNSGQAVVYLRILASERMLLVHIGENESNALLKEINKQKQMRPLTHDVMRNMLKEINFRVTKIRITDIVANTYYARIHMAKVNSQGLVEADSEVDVDARPSDAINLAVRFGAPMYVNRRIADAASTLLPEPAAPSNESSADIVKSVREALATFEDPTVMYQLQKELAVKEERFEDAAQLQQHIYHEMTHNQLLRLVVAMETALSDGRYEEAARLRDEYKSRVAQGQVNAASEQRRV